MSSHLSGLTHPQSHGGQNDLIQKMYELIVHQEAILQQLVVDFNSRMASVEDNLFELTDSVVNIEKKTLSSYTHIKTIANSFRIPAESDIDSHVSKPSRRRTRSRARPARSNFLPTYTSADKQNRIPNQFESQSSTSDTDKGESPFAISFVPISKSESLPSGQIINPREPLVKIVHHDLKNSGLVLPHPEITLLSDFSKDQSHDLQRPQKAMSETTTPGSLKSSLEKITLDSNGDKNLDIKMPEPQFQPNGEQKPEYASHSLQPHSNGVKQSVEDLTPTDRELDPHSSHILDLSNPESVISSLGLGNNDEAVAAIKLAYQSPVPEQNMKAKGLYTVLVLDTSASMEGEAFKQMTQFVGQFLDEVDNAAGERFLDETVAIVTCGGQTDVAVDFTIDYIVLREFLNNMQPHGKMPLLTALALALCYIHKQGKVLSLGGLTVSPRIILVSDGEVTNDATFTGLDQEPTVTHIQTQTKILNLTKTLKCLGYPLYCVGVGEFNAAFLSSMVQVASGKLIAFENSCVLGKYYYHQTIVAKILSEGPVDSRRDNLPQIIQTIEPNIDLDDTNEIMSLLQSGNHKTSLPKSLSASSPPPATLSSSPSAARTSQNVTSTAEKAAQQLESYVKPNVSQATANMSESLTGIHTERYPEVLDRENVRGSSVNPSSGLSQQRQEPSQVPQHTQVSPGSGLSQQGREPLQVPQHTQVSAGSGLSQQGREPSQVPQHTQVSAGSGLSQQGREPSQVLQHIQISAGSGLSQQGQEPSQVPQHTQVSAGSGLSQQGQQPSQVPQHTQVSPGSGLSQQRREPSQIPNPIQAQTSPLSGSDLASSEGATRMEWETCDLQERVSLLILGSRVVRGPHWKYDNDDEGFPGTVVGHQNKDKMYVLWDCGKSGVYRYGVNNEVYDVFPTDQMRALSNDNTLQIGCVVKRGPHWDRHDEDGGQNTVGSVIRKHSANDVSIRWPSGVIDKYKYDPNGIQEITLANFSEIQAFFNIENIPASHRHAPSPSQPVAIWKWTDRLNTWHQFDESTSLKIESDYKKNKGSSIINLEGCNLRLIFSKMEFRDFEKKITGKIQRSELTP